MPTFSWDSHRTTKENDKDQDPPQNGEQQEHKAPAPDASTDATPAKPEEQHDTSTKSFEPTRLNFPSHLDSDKKDNTSPFNFTTLAERSNGAAAPASMPHRVEPPYPMTSSHRRHYEYDHRHRPSPPPISTLTHSPTPSVSSLDRSSVSTPPVRRSPPHTMPPPPHLYASPYPPDPAMMNRHFRPEYQHPHHGYMYAPAHHPYDPQQDGPMPQQSPYHGSAALPPHMVPAMRADHHHHPYGAPPPPPPQQQHPYPGQQPGLAIVHTDDAATKLSDRVRRRCFNCCTTDTSTWRRSNLSPGKVLCNKCGLFERTHSRPRPEQFPHKRGPLSTSTLRGRTPPQTQLPPISPSFHYTHPPPPPPPPSHQQLMHHPQQQHQQHQHQQQHQQHQQQHPADTGRREYTTHPPHPAGPPPLPGSNSNNNSGSSSADGPGSGSGAAGGSSTGGNGNGNGNGNGTTTLPGLQTWHHESISSSISSSSADIPPPPSLSGASRRSTIDGGAGGAGGGAGSAGGSRQPSPPLTSVSSASRPGSAHQQQGQQQEAAAAA